jgi:hypothetical protein
MRKERQTKRMMKARAGRSAMPWAKRRWEYEGRGSAERERMDALR